MAAASKTSGRRAKPEPPTRPVLRERYERRRRDVIAAAAKLFAERGYQATSMADLTTATGLAAGGLYHYIESKEELLILICDELLDPLLVRAREIVANELPPAQQVRALLHAWLEQIASHREHMLVFAQERHVIEREPQWRRVRAQRKEFEQLLDDVLARGEGDGTMHFDDRAFTLLTLLGMVNYTPQWLRPRGRLSPTEIADGYCDVILAATQAD
ncbi:MAG TPA: TetR/AcrR family transcriptional regulator [Solirubrobacterales bacterium]|nr:TetR/AcrR family transcriptional regulator [Solirubrobacterales bacterium]